MLISIVSRLKSLAHLVSCELWRSVVSLNVVSIRQREPSSDNIWNKISLVRHLLLKVHIKFSVYKQTKQTTNQPTKQTLQSEDKSLCSAAGATNKQECLSALCHAWKSPISFPVKSRKNCSEAQPFKTPQIRYKTLQDMTNKTQQVA